MDGVPHGPGERSRWSAALFGLFAGWCVFLVGTLAFFGLTALTEFAGSVPLLVGVLVVAAAAATAAGWKLAVWFRRRSRRTAGWALGISGLLALVAGLTVLTAPPRIGAPAPGTGGAIPRGGPILPGGDPAPGGSVVQSPVFPWPPPRASARTTIPPALFAKLAAGPPTLGDVDRKLAAALDANDYSERSYYLVPDGFAIATRLEQINSDGTPKAGTQRWLAGSGPLREFSLRAYLAALFSANQGYYRVIVFIVTPHPFSQADVSVRRDEAIAWLSEGLNTLPRSIAEKPYSHEHSCSALIYEFEQPSQSKAHEAKIQIPGRLPAGVHLRKANLWKELER